MKHYPVEKLGFFASLKTQEDTNLYSLASKLVEENLGRDLTNTSFMVQLMRDYVDSHKPNEVNLSSRPRM
jgi:hypothetical protein